MTISIPRILFAAPSSGSGKTTAVCTVLELLMRKKLTPCSFKCGPDYIDPMFHKTVLGIDGSNLDPFFCGRNMLKDMLSSGTATDISVIEGVMGYYDGTGSAGMDNSTYTVAKATDSPVILVINGKGAAASLIALIEGFKNFMPDSNIKGVLFNRMSAMTYRYITGLMYQRFGNSVTPVGFIPQLPENCEFKSRHLGLITAPEIKDLRATISSIADLCSETVDIDGIISIAHDAPSLECSEAEIPWFSEITLAVARDDAFCFYYNDTLRMFERMGAALEYFSPLNNDPVPDGADGLLLGGGYPELYSEKLELNTVSKHSICAAIGNGMPVIAECGGFQYLGTRLVNREMCGVLPHESSDKGKLVRFGYATLTASEDGLLLSKGGSIKAHEFHYYDSTENGNAFTAVKPDGRSWKCAVMTDRMYAGYPHLYLPSCPEAAVNFYSKCVLYKSERKLK